MADVYDALTSRRPYKQAFEHHIAKGIADRGINVTVERAEAIDRNRDTGKARRFVPLA